MADRNYVTLMMRKTISAPDIAKEGEKTVETRYVAALNQNLSRLGFTLSADFIAHLQKCTKETVIEFYNVINKGLLELVGNIPVIPIWPNFPEDVKEVGALELYLVNILHYLTQKQWTPEYNPEKELPALIDFSKLRVIDISPEGEYEEIVEKLILQNMPLSDNDRTIISQALSEEDIRNKIEQRISGKKISQKETLAIVTAIYIRQGIMPDYLEKQFVNAREVLRVIAVMSEADVSLSKSFRICNIGRKQRKILLGLIERQTTAKEDMVPDREVWKRIGEKLHPGEYKDIFPNAYAAFTAMRNNDCIETYMSVMERLFTEADYIGAASHLKNRPGLFARYLDMLLRKSWAKDNSGELCKHVIDVFSEVADQVEMRVLLSLKNHLANRDNEIKIAVGKGNGASVMAQERTVEEIGHEIRESADKAVSQAISKIFASKEKAGKIYTDAPLENIKMPVTLRHTKRALYTAVTGSVFALDDDVNVVRGFCYWKADDSHYCGIDIDLSATFMDDEYNTMFSVGYFSAKNEKVQAVHSGDVRSSGKEGACEYLDFNIRAAQENNVRYAAYTVNSYCNDKFSDIDVCFMGFMGRDGKTGDIFEPKTVKNRFDLTCAATESLMFVIDVEKRLVYIVDYSIGSQRYSNAYDQKDIISTLTKAVVEDKSCSIRDILNIAVCGEYLEIVETPEEADIIITENDIKLKEGTRKINPYDIASVVELFI